MNAEHMLNLSGRLDAPQNPKDELSAVLQDVVKVLPRAVVMLQEAGKISAFISAANCAVALVDIVRVGMQDVCWLYC